MKMRFILLFLFNFISISAAGIPLPALSSSDVQLRSSFEAFKENFQKQYAENENEARFTRFTENVRRAHALNAKRPHEHAARFGVTQFSDLSREEFASNVLAKPRPPVKLGEPQAKHASPFPSTAHIAQEPQSFDWRDHGAVTAVKNQGACGSCWAFSTTENVESVWILAGHASNESLALAPQQLVDCSDLFDFGCDGGNPPFAFESVIYEGGMESESAYPYQARYTGSCKLNKTEIVAKISGFFLGNFPGDETVMRKTLVDNAPLSIAVDAMSWQLYESGVMTASQCETYDLPLLDHAVQLVGYDLSAPSPFYWVRNSWSPSWGIDGYIKLEVGDNTCGIAIETSTSYVD